MSDKAFEVSMITLTAVILVAVVAGIVLGILGYPWADMHLGWLIFLTILIGLVVLIVCGSALLWAWGKNYMSRG